MVLAAWLYPGYYTVLIVTL